ncbi:ABC transporter ATP-binding protein [bacterium]|nr:ABC transporter ATP-binding protein [candidate division CSSED10-310 bacterium]
MKTHSDPIVRLENVTRHFHQGETIVRAVDGVDLEVYPGEFTVISGPSGSGKTTILNLIGALDDPTEGKIWVEGKNLSSMSRSERSVFRRDRIGFVFQAYNLIPVLTALENAEFILTLQGVPSSERKERVLSLMKEVELEGLENRRPDEMSGGQQQRIAIIRAIISNPAIVLADEPTANVDTATAGKILDLMAKLNREKNATFLFSTHDHNVIERASRVIRMQDGKIIKNDLQSAIENSSEDHS